MKPSIEKLEAQRKKYYSQHGEDGLLEYVLSRLPATDNWCVEFGAWDGKHLSNTYHFVSAKGFNAVLIEADPQKCEVLRENMKNFKAICVNSMVGFEGDSRLDAILAKTPIPKDFDLLSIDVDGDDFHIWQAMAEYKPKVVIVEINVRDKPGVDRVNTHGTPVVWGVSGTSIKSMTELAKSKGYSLIANVATNAIYVRSEYLGLFHDGEVTPADVFTYEGHMMSELTPEEKAHLGGGRVFWRSLRHFARKLIGRGGK